MSDDNSTKIYARQYTSKKGNRYYWGKFGGYEVRIFRGKDHEGSPSLDVHIKPVKEAPPEEEPVRTELDDDDIPF